MSTIPADHAYITLLICGSLDAGLRRECERKDVRRLETPFGLAQLREELASPLP